MDLNSILGAAQARLKELRKELGKLDLLRNEEQKLARLLEGHGHPRVAAVFKPRGRKPKGKGGRPPSKLGLATGVLKKFAGTNGMTVREILERLRKSNADLFKHRDAAALLSRAFGQSMKGKSPRVKVIVKGGPGRAARYGAASSVAPDRKLKGKGLGAAKNGAPSKLALATEVLQKSPKGMTITEMLERLRKSHGELFKAKHAHKMLANALRQDLRSKTPRVKVLAKGGRGKAATYGVAA